MHINVNDDEYNIGLRGDPGAYDHTRSTAQGGGGSFKIGNL